jgi:glycosyltransferase involved in cell wall biosynthesis
MSLLGLIPEPPFDRLSWSGSSANFFGALRNHGVLGNAREVSLGPYRELVEKGRAFSMPMSRWKERYHSSVSRFAALTRSAGRIMAEEGELGAVLQIGAWFSAGACTRAPCFSYHDGNAALSYRYYGRGLVSESRRRAHLQWEESVYSALTGIFVMSNWLADSFKRDFGVHVSKLHVVGAGINMDIPPVVPERSWSLPRYLLVGKDFERKGGKYLLEAFHAVRRALPEAELIIVGPELSLTQPGVQCLGFLSKSDPADLARLRALYGAATAVVLPSVYEPFGISLLEGMAYGLPCIAADRCAMPEIVRHGETGLVVRAEDSESLANAMIELGSSPGDAARMGSAGRRCAESTFTWATVTGKIKAVLSDKYHV